MNIHIKNKELFEKLQSASLASGRFGSFLYKTNDEFSDSDIHYVYTTSVPELNSFLKSHHHLQWKENGVDHIFVNLHTFLSNLIKGDSAVLFELIHSESFKDTSLGFIYEMRNSFINYAIIRAYLGFARRDCQFYHRKQTHRDQLKALGHIHRGYFFAKSLMNKDFKLVDDDFLKVFSEIKLLGEKDFKAKKEFLNNGQELVTNLREELNQRFNNNTLNLPKYMDLNDMSKLDNEIEKLMLSDEWKLKQSYLSDFNMDIFYDAYENEINY